MVVLVLLACLNGQPDQCTSVNMKGLLPYRQCELFATPEARDFEHRNPSWRVSRTWCLRLGGQQV